MRNLKKFLALVLAMLMTFSLMLTVNAATTSDFTDKDAITKEFAEDIEVLRGMGVFEGYTDGSFQPKGSITRAEVATIVYRIATDDPKGNQAHLYKDYQKFDDVKSDHWAAGYINFCANAEWIAGYGNGKFGPNDYVTGYQAAAMILRAVGYGKNNEFVGPTWQVQVANVTRSELLLVNVDNTTYANTLNQPATRELVGEILFQAANIPTVTWTMLGGYSKTDNVLGTGTTNRSLGRINYGLTSATRVILGNQATGEGGTLLGNGSTTYKDATGQTQSLDVSYVYPGSQIDLENDVTPAGDAGDTLTVGNGIKVDAKTGLDKFGHKVTVWYNADSTATWKPTYAMFDRATLTATVQSLTNGPADDPNLSTGTKGLGLQAQKAGFTVDLDNSKAWISDRYGRIMGSSAAGDTAAAGNTKAQGAVGNANNGIYALISNNSGKTVDVIIALQGEVGIIAQKDTTSTVQTVTVGGTNAGITKGTFQGTGTSVFATDSLTAESTQTLGDKVIAWQVVGTNNATSYAGAPGSVLGNAGTHTNGNTNNYRYYLEKLEKTVTGTIQSIGANNDLTMSDGTVYKQSWFRKLPNTQATDKVIGNDNTEECFTIPASFQAGVNYTVALDSFGNWLGLVPAPNNFIYGTFADYEFGGLGSGSMKYTITGVDWDGKKVINSEFKSLSIGGTLYPSTAGDLGKGYSLDTFTVTKKFLGDNNTSGQGNQIKSGSHTGYVLDANGLLDNNVPGSQGQRLTTDWTIKASDVTNGFADLSGGGSALATPNTKFIVVSGTGTDTLDVKIYNGISEFLNGASWVTIDGSGTVGDPGGPKSNTYYITEADRFNKWDTTANKQIASVIMDLRDVKWSNKTDVYYAAPGANATDTGVQLAGTTAADNIKQYELYKDGVKGYYFIKTDVGTAYSPTNGATAPTGNATNGDFYTMIQIDTINGTPIYKAVREATQTAPATDQVRMDTRANGGNCLRGVYYENVGLSNMSTARIGSEVFDVSNAKVVDVEWTASSTRSQITNLLELNNATSGGYANVQVAIVYDGVSVSTIYVYKVATSR